MKTPAAQTHADEDKRVLLFIDSLKAGGAERSVLSWASWLNQEGWKVTLLTSKGAEHDFYPCPVELERLLEPGTQGRGRAGLRWPFRILALRRLLRRGRYSLLIGVTTLPAIKLTLSALGSGIPVVVAERNYPPARPLSLPWRLLRRMTYPYASLHLVQTERIATWLRQKGLARRTACLPNAVVWPQISHSPCIAPEDWLSGEARLMLAVGTKLHQKGFDRLVKAFGRIAPRWPDWQLAILGIDHNLYKGIDQVSALEAILPDPSLRRRLIFPGKVGNPADWYARSDLFVLSSRYEGFPNVLLEAMAAGCACLASDCPTGPSELVKHGYNGWLVPECDAIEGLSEGMEHLMADSLLRQHLAAAATQVRTIHAPSAIQAGFISIMSTVRP